MPRNGLLQAFAIQDVQQTWSWGIVIPRIPGVGDARGLSTKCVSTEVPGFQIEPVKVDFQGGIQLGYAGRRIWSMSWSATFIESRDGSSRDDMVAWANLIRNPLLGTGSYKVVYAVPVELSLYDDAGIVSRSFKLVNAFPLDVSQATLDQSSGVLQYPVTFSYDVIEES